MSSENSEIRALKAKNSELESDIRDRDQEIAFLKNELGEVNFRLERLVEQVQHELKMISKIQDYLVPSEFPNISGFEFSTKFVPSAIRGGDYFDIFDIANRMKFGIVMSSASGYAMSALMMSVLMKFSGFRLAEKSESVDEIAKKILQELGKNLSREDSASLFFGLVNRRDHKLQYYLSGDLQAFHFDYGEDKIKPLEAAGGLISWSEKGLAEKGLKSSELALNPRDRLIICSTGLFEVTNLSGQAFTVDQVTQVIRSSRHSGVHELRNNILFEAEKFASGAEPRRDKTVVVIDVKDRVIKLA